jgi:hypothetical protein
LSAYSRLASTERPRLNKRPCSAAARQHRSDRERVQPLIEVIQGIRGSFASPRLRSRRPEIRAGIDALVTETGADELIVVSDIFDHAKRLRSFELIADVAGIKAEPKPVLMAAASPA